MTMDFYDAQFYDTEQERETTMQYDNKDTKDELKKDLKEVLDQIDEQMDVIKEEAIATEQSPMQMKDADGRWIFVDLIVAKTDALHSLVKLEDS